MNAKQRIGRLEELLNRVKTRAAAPRPGSAMEVPSAMAAAAPAYAPPPFAQPPPAPVVLERHAHATSFAEEEPRTTDYEMEVEVSTETVDIDIDVEEAIAGEEVMAMESGAQLVAAGGYRGDEGDALATEPPEAAADMEDRTLAGANVLGAANELEEPAPSSSPRPIEAEAALAAEEESAPRHTPPPESGKQVAAPSASPPRASSAPPGPLSEPPSSIGGHTIIGVAPGAYRAPAVPSAEPRPPAAPPAKAAPPQAPPARVVAEVTRPNLPAVAKVAAFEGAAPVFKPASFGDLLDATLGL